MLEKVGRRSFYFDQVGDTLDTLIDMEAFCESPRDVKLISRTGRLLERSR